MANDQPKIAMASSVPEPTTWALMLIGLSGLGGALRSRHRAPSCNGAPFGAHSRSFRLRLVSMGVDGRAEGDRQMGARNFIAALGAATLLAGFGMPVTAAQLSPARVFDLSVMGGPVGRGGMPLIPEVMVSFSSADYADGAYPTILDMGHGRTPRLTNDAPGGRFNFYLAVQGLADGSVTLPDQPNSDGFTSFHHTFVDGGGDSHSLIALLRVGPAAITPGSWTSFNPQPEPPGFVAGVGMTFPSDPYVSFSLNLDGRQLTFAPVPEPAAWAVMLAGLALTGAAVRLHRRAQPMVS